MKSELAELQMLLMDQQRSLESLGDQLVIQSETLLGLEKRVNLLEVKLCEVNQLAGQASEENDPPPPHY